MSEKYTDVRKRAVVELLDTCTICKADYVMRLHVRHCCGDCRLLHESEHVFGKPWDDMWKRFDGLVERMFGRS